MDDAIPILLSVVIVVILSAIALPIIALAISIRSKKKLTQEIARLHATRSLNPDTLQQLRISDLSPLARAIKEIEARTEKLETALKAHSILLPESSAEHNTPATTPTAPPATEHSPRVETPRPPIPPSPMMPEAPPVVTPVFSPPPTRAMQANQIESIIGRRLLGWAAVGLIL